MKNVVTCMIIMIATVTSDIDAKIMRRMKEVETALSRPVMTPPATVSVIDQGAIKKRLDEQLRSPVEVAWNDRINDLFDLATVNRELARDYFIKMRTKMESAEIRSVEDGEKVIARPVGVKSEEIKTEIAPVVEKPAESIVLPAEEPMKKATGRPAPPRRPGLPKEEVVVPKVETSEGLVAAEEPMKKSTMPAPKKGAPSGGPKKILTPAKEGAAKPVASKEEVASKVVPQIFSVPKLQQLDNEKLLELLSDLLDKLGTVASNWNSTIVEKVEEKTKYGYKVYNVYGAPVAQWMNNITTLKKVIISKNIMSEEEIIKKIADRIAQVRAEKVVKPAMQPEVEKQKEELTEEDLVRLIKGLLAEPKPTEIGWAVSIKGNIKALDKVNHAMAMQYHDQFIKITKEKPFLK